MADAAGKRQVDERDASLTAHSSSLSCMCMMHDSYLRGHMLVASGVDVLVATSTWCLNDPYRASLAVVPLSDAVDGRRPSGLALAV